LVQPLLLSSSSHSKTPSRHLSGSRTEPHAYGPQGCLAHASYVQVKDRLDQVLSANHRERIHRCKINKESYISSMLIRLYHLYPLCIPPYTKSVSCGGIYN
jgi:hypothetical protein